MTEIVLRLIPLKWADPESKKLLVSDDSVEGIRYADPSGEGFCSGRQAFYSFLERRVAPQIRPVHEARLVEDTAWPIHCVIWSESRLWAVYIVKEVGKGK
jgi:hypothetical protein